MEDYNTEEKYYQNVSFLHRDVWCADIIEHLWDKYINVNKYKYILLTLNRHRY